MAALSSKFGTLPRSIEGPMKCPLEVCGGMTSLSLLVNALLKFSFSNHHWSGFFYSQPAQGFDLLRSPDYNKGSAFPSHERSTFHLEGLLPPRIQTLEDQVERAYEQYSKCRDALEKNTFMTSMKDQNTVLYYKVCKQGAEAEGEPGLVDLEGFLGVGLIRLENEIFDIIFCS